MTTPDTAAVRLARRGAFWLFLDRLTGLPVSARYHSRAAARADLPRLLAGGRVEDTPADPEACVCYAVAYAAWRAGPDRHWPLASPQAPGLGKEHAACVRGLVELGMEPHRDPALQAAVSATLYRSALQQGVCRELAARLLEIGARESENFPNPPRPATV